ncbi:MAG: GPI anchored serine-threonine rich family protein [Melioribacteraceae bacterium]|nr:GPI anchored serine-threonine rich family protein [Melioribacteraceae bacterium]MCF8355252.1 GPI anchored serine-threonine rich family protein [Melioribacteraceae bacterium]MCF8394151.1 GPI anchored serine-threonine rich family protein [Melioribacteraceae bacterium]MCF8418834.1 GPI anchored serine-threonine rich family protein [Melioribacteraceae bacterium]
MKRFIPIIILIIALIGSCELKQDSPTEPGSPTSPDSTLSALIITKPNGGDTLREGSTFEITWEGNTTSLLELDYSIDNGASWLNIADSIVNTGTYQWFPIPNKISNQCKVRISTLEKTQSDESDNVFSIIKSSTKSLTVNTPNGGEQLFAGEDGEIRWFSSGIDSVRIEYTTNNGRNWNFIAVDTVNTGIYFWSPIPNTPSGLSKVRIMDAKAGFPMDESDDFFFIQPETFISLNIPNGGENWLSGTSQTVKWISNNIAYVKIEYSTNGGSDWMTVVDSTESIGTYTWDLIPSHYSENCRMRISDANDGEPYDISSAPFTISNQITQQITVLTPNGNETWEAGTNQNITWQSTGIDRFNIELSTNNGSTWQVIAEDITNSGYYAWNVPNAPSTQCIIRVSDSGDGKPADESNASFTIDEVATLTLTYPNGGELIRAGEGFNITWDYSGVKNVTIEWTENNGISAGDWFTMVSNTPCDGVYEASFTRPSSLYKVRISEASSGFPKDESNGIFTVLPQTSVTVTSPNGGEEWLVGEQYEIAWTSINVPKVKIEYTLNDGDKWNPVVSDLTNGGYYFWELPQTIEYKSTLCKIRVSEYLAEDPEFLGATDESDDFFTIDTKYLRVISPNGGEQLAKDFISMLEWNSGGIEYVNLEYTLDNGVNWETITTNYPSTGGYEWLTPDIVSSNARIRITDSSDPDYTDQSDGVFSIVSQIIFITIIRPALNETVIAGSEFDITWSNTDDISSVTISYSINNGVDWIEIDNSVLSPGDIQNSYSWNVPPTPTEYGRIMITDNSSPYFVISDRFSIR